MINIEILVYMVYNGSNLKVLNLMDEYCRFSRQGSLFFVIKGETSLEKTQFLADFIKN